MSSIGKKWKKRSWSKISDRRRAIVDLARELHKKPRELTSGDLRQHRLGTVLGLYGDKMHRLLKELGFIKSALECLNLPKGFLAVSSNAREAIEAILRRFRKPMNELTGKDFEACGINQTSIVRVGGVFGLLRKAGYNFEPWEVAGGVRDGYWQRKSNRVKAIKWVVQRKLKGKTNKLTLEVLEKYGLARLNFHKPMRGLLIEAGYAEPDHYVGRNHWKNKVNVKDAVEKLLKESGRRDVRDLYIDDFINKRCSGLLDAFKGNLCSLFRFAGYDVAEEDFRGKAFGQGRWPSKGTHKLISGHGHSLYSNEERNFDDLLNYVGIGEHDHDIPYPGSLLRCDAVTKDRTLWFEYAGVDNQRTSGRCSNSIQEKYRKRIMRKRRLARTRGLALIIFHPRDLRHPKAEQILRQKIDKAKEIQERNNLTKIADER